MFLFEVVVDRLEPARSWPITRWFRWHSAWQNFSTDAPSEAALGEQVTPLSVETQVARMDLTFSLAERWNEIGEPARIGGTVEFRTDVFDAGSIEVLVGRLQRVLDSVVADPGRLLSSVDVLDVADRVRLDEIGNRGVLTTPAVASVGSGGVHRAGGVDAGCGGVGLWGSVVDVSGVG